jgi:hypothetical protein
MPRHTPRKMHHATGSRFIKRNCCMTQTNTQRRLPVSDARVHYVVLKQQPRTTPPHTHRPPKEGNSHARTDHAARKTGNTQTRNTKHPTLTGHAPHATALLPQDPTVCQTRKPACPPPAPFQDTRKHPYQGQERTNRPLSADIPPMSTHRRTDACAMGFASTHPGTHPCRQNQGDNGAP